MSRRRPGSQGWWDDDRAHLDPWRFELCDITVPALLLYGRQDNFVPFGHGQWLATHIPGVEARLREDDGHLTLAEGIALMGCLVVGKDRCRDAPTLADLDALLFRPLPHIGGVSAARGGTSCTGAAAGDSPAMLDVGSNGLAELRSVELVEIDLER